MVRCMSVGRTSVKSLEIPEQWRSQTNTGHSKGFMEERYKQREGKLVERWNKCNS